MPYNYYVLEIQTNADGTGAVAALGFVDVKEAISTWHEKCKYAIQSNVLCHTVSIVTRGGRVYDDKVESYIHPQPEE